MIPIKDFKEGDYLFMATKKGLVKKTPILDYANVRKTGLAAITLREDDELIEVKITDDERDVIISLRSMVNASVSMNLMYVQPEGPLWAFVV